MSEKMSFEQIIAELEQIQNQLSSPNIELEKLVDLYERGTKLSIIAQNILQDAKKRTENIFIVEDKND